MSTTDSDACKGRCVCTGYCSPNVWSCGAARTKQHTYNTHKHWHADKHNMVTVDAQGMQSACNFTFSDTHSVSRSLSTRCLKLCDLNPTYISWLAFNYYFCTANNSWGECQVVSWLQGVVGHLLHGTDVFACLLVDGSNQLLRALILDSMRNVPFAGN